MVAVTRFIKCVGCLMFAVCCAASGGCNSKSSVDRVELSGRVSFEGKNIPKGRIDFIPDTNRGASGPAGYALIENGVYDTRQQGRGVVLGAHRVQIQGFDGIAVGDEGGENGHSLFPTMSTVVEIGPGQDVLNFELPLKQ